jgi:hypothetical protein
MWQLDNRTPFAAERTWTRDRDGAAVWLVAVKATFDILPDGSTAPAGDQPPVVIAPEYTNPRDPAHSSLRYDVDLVPTKTTTDVLVLGRAHAPGGTPVTSLDVAFRVGPVAKRLRVTGDRVWRRGSITAPAAFTTMPIVYERAYGGTDPQSRTTGSPKWDVRNPVGTGFAEDESGFEGLALPNVEYPDQLMGRRKDRPPPAGFGPVCAHWHPRAKLAGTYDSAWQQDRFPLLPADFDDRYYQCAPPDQQTPRFLQGGEACELVNLTASGALRFALPQRSLAMETTFLTGERQRHETPRLHTVIVEPDVPRVSLVWHSALPCHPRVYKLQATAIVEEQMTRSAGGAEEPRLEKA